MTSGMQHGPMGRRAWSIVRTARRALADRAGAAMVEFAFVGGLFFMLMFGVIEIGRGLWTMNALHYAVQQAARCAAVNFTECGNGTTATEPKVQAFAIGVSAVIIPDANDIRLNPASATVPWAPTCNTATNRLVTASYAMPLYIPFVSMQPTLTAASCFPISHN